METTTIITDKETKRGLVIRYFFCKYVLCDGKAPAGCENDGELYVGNIVKWCETWEEANQMRKMIAALYQ